LEIGYAFDSSYNKARAALEFTHQRVRWIEEKIERLLDF